MKPVLTALFSLMALLVNAQSPIVITKPYAESFALKVNELAKGFFVAAIPKKPEPEEWSKVENFAFGKDRGSLTMVNDLRALHPYFRDRIFLLINTCKSKGIELSVVETYRSPTKQNEYKTMGKKFTRSGGGTSKHQYGLAVDLVPIVNDTAQWHNEQLWKKIGMMGEQLGLRWGGRWRNPYDPGHFEWTNGLTSTQLAAGHFPKLPGNLVDYPCLEEDLALLSLQWKEWEVQQSSTFLARQYTSGYKSN